MDIRRVLEALRAVSFGGLVAAGIGAIIYYRFQGIFGFIPSYWFIGTCGAIGTASQQAIQTILNIIFKPIFGLLTFHEKIMELRQLRGSGRISDKKFQQLVDKLCEKRFLE